MSNIKSRYLIWTFFLLNVILISSCNPATNNVSSDPTNEIQVWAHAGQATERLILQSQVARFNRQTPNANISLIFIPEQHYNAQIQAAALADNLPDVLELDGPYLYNYVWQGHLMPLEHLLSDTVISDLLPSIIEQGTFGQHLYAVGVYDSGLGLYARLSSLQGINARIPTAVKDAWNINEFNAILLKLAQLNHGQAVLDLKLNYSNEWITFGFSPILLSAGADLIERKNYQTSSGILNSKQAVFAMQQLQNWIQKGLIDPNLDDAAFISGRVALSWSGHWDFEQYKKVWQNDLVILPLPNFGSGSRTGQGSWNWGITNNTRNPKLAAQFLNFLLQTDEVLAMSHANNAVPGVYSALEKAPHYHVHGELRLFADQLLQNIAIPRPKTPAYPMISIAFQQAFQQMRHGANVKQVLTNATHRINQDIHDNQGYRLITKTVPAAH